jgi:hypothetical protein
MKLPLPYLWNVELSEEKVEARRYMQGL